MRLSINAHRRGRRRTAGLLGIVVALAIAASGCSGSSGNTSSSDGGGTDRSLVVGRSFAMNNLDPHKTLFSADCQILCAVYDRLIVIAADGSLEPGIATAWEFSDDGMSLTLDIRDDVTFGDGTVLDAKGVKMNLDRARGLEDSAVKADLAAVSKVVAVDDSTVRIDLAQPDSRLPGVLSVLAGTIINPTALKDGTDLSAETAGSGPFEVASYSADSGITLRARDGYWGDAPAMSTLEVKFITDDSALTNALLAGQVDITEILPQNLTPFADNDKFVIKSVTSLNQVQIAANFDRTGLSDPRVRQAILYAIDREGNCENILKGYCEVSDQPFPEGNPANDGSIDQILYPYDPDRAKELLAEAGVDVQKLTLLVPLQSYMPMAQAIQAQLEDVGIDLDVQLADGSTFAQKVFLEKTADMGLSIIGGQPDPARLFGVRYLAESFYNASATSTDKMTSLYAKILETTDPDERTALVQEGSREVAESAIGLLLYHPATVYVMKDGVDLDPAVTPFQPFSAVTFTS